MPVYEDIKIGTHIHGITDSEEISRAEELSVIDRNWTKITQSSESGDVVDAMVFRVLERQKLRFRQVPLSRMAMGRMVQSKGFESLFCDECGSYIDISDYAIWSGGKHYCMSCARNKYSEYVDYEGLMCTRCGEDILPGDDIWGFDTDSHSEIDMCMCSRCAYITHRFPPWEQLLKET